jgi:hypothetical protein
MIWSTPEAGCAAASASGSSEVGPQQPQVISRREVKSPIASWDLRQKMIAPTATKTADAKSVIASI